MYLKNLFKDSTIFEFVMLAPLSSFLILIGSIISGFLQSASVLAVEPLMKNLNVVGDESKNKLVMEYLENMIIWLGLDYSIVAVSY